jgi:hypothetical protein
MARTASTRETDAFPVIDGEVLRDDAPIYGDDSDTEKAWSEWGDNLKQSQTKGIIRVAKVPTNDDGTPNPIKKGQAQLFSFPHDQYSFDEVLDKIRLEFMEPGETICIRLTGVRTSASGHSGVVPFNRILSVTRSRLPGPLPTGDGSQLSDVLRQFREMSAAQGKVLQDLLARPAAEPPPQVKPAGDIVKEWLGILLPTITPIALALIARQPKGGNDLTSMINALAQLKGLMPGENNGDGDDNSTLGIIKSVAPQGLALLTELAKNRQPQAALVSQNQAPRVNPNQPTRPALPVTASDPTRPTTVAPDPVVRSPNPAELPTDPKQLEEQAMFNQLKPVLEQLAEFAEQNADIEQVAPLLMDMLPEAYDDTLYQSVSDPQKFARLKLLCPKMELHPQWWEALRVRILAEYSDDADTAPVATN